jgi:DNA invertase Pin-like site-specific DNA recombinase
MSRVVLYRRISMAEERVTKARQVEARRLGLRVQEEALAGEAQRRGWESVEWVTEDGVSGKVEPAERPELGPVLCGLRRGDVLAVAKLDRLSRSLAHFAVLVEELTRRGVAVVVLDAGVDSSTPHGEAMVNMMATFARLERRLISDRTRAAKLSVCATEIPGWIARRDEVWRLHDAGLSERRIAGQLGCSRATVTRTLRRPRP